MKILVVDDCRTTRKLIGMYLRSKGYEVLVAENGLDAIEKLGSEKVSLVLSDLNMPYMDGIEFIKTLRSDPHWVELPVLMITTEDDAVERELALEAGADGYLVKPVTAEVVYESVERIMKDSSAKGGTDV